MLCERCGAEHDGSIGTGRFCSRSCANARRHSPETKKKTARSLTKERFREERTCKHCGSIFTYEYLLSDLKYNRGVYCSSACSRAASLERIQAMPMTDATRAKMSQTRKRKFSEGTQNVTGGTAKWFPYKDIKVQGTYELRTCFILDEMMSSGEISKWEYTNDRYDYIDVDGTPRVYLLDFKVFDTNGGFYYLEVKGYHTDTDLVKWATVRKIADLRVWYLEDIEAREKLLELAA